MSRYFEKADITHGIAIMVLAKLVFLHITHTLHYKTYNEQNDTSDIAARAKLMLRVLRHVGRVQDGHGERYRPHPNHLEDPEAEKGEKLVALVVEAVV